MRLIMKFLKFNAKKTIPVLMGLLLGTLSFVSPAYSDEVFVQDGKEYVIKEGVVGVMKKPTTEFAQDTSQKNQTFFDTYDSSKLKAQGGALSGKQKYRVVYRLEKNLHTNKVKEIPGLLTNNLIVEAKSHDSLSSTVNLRLKKSYKENGFYVYELPDDKAVSEVLAELAKNPDVLKTHVEVIEHLRVPM